MSTETDEERASIETEAPEAVDLSSTIGSSIRSIVSDLGEHASVRSVYGDPIEVDGRTIVPVARVGYGFGGGFGRDGGDPGGGGEGGGGGGGVSAKPVGVVEVDGAETRFVRFGDRRRAGLALLAGVVLGLLLGRR